MKSTPHGLLKAALLLFAKIIFILTFPITGNGQHFPLPGTFLYATNLRHNQVFDISPDSKIAIALTNGPIASQSPFLTTFDPILGTEFDHKSFGFGPFDVRMAQVENKLRAVVLASEGGPAKIYLFDVGPAGQLTQIAATQLTTSVTSGQSNVVLSGNGAVGFVAIHTGVNILGELVSFSLTDGAIIKRFPLPDVPISIALNEGPNRRLVAFCSGNNVKVVNVLDATQPVEIASVPLVPNGEVSGVLGDALTFSSDGHFVFFAGQNFTFAAINVDTAQIVGTIPGDFRFFRIESFEDNQRRLLAVLSGRAGNGGTPALLLVDATNPNALTVVNSVAPNEFSRAVFGFSHDGSRLYVAEPTRLVAFNLPGFTSAWEQSVPGDSQIPLQLRVYGATDEILGAWHMSPGTNFLALMGAFPASPPNVLVNDSAVSENGGTASVTVSLSAPTNHRVTVKFSTLGGTALGGVDYTNSPGSITLEPGVLSGSFTIPIINDDLDETDETVILKITPDLGIVTRSQIILTILDDDPTPTLTISDISGIEGKFGNALFFEVTLSAASGRTVTVEYATAANSASEIDFVPLKGALTFFAGQTTNTVVVPIFADELSESDETFTVNLSNPNNAIITDGQGTGTIIDDDAPLLATEAAPSQRAIALDAIMLREPFLLNNPNYLGTDKRARISLFTLNLILTPGLVVTAEAVDGQQVVHQLPVESVQNVPNFLATAPEEPFLTQIVLKLPEGIVSAGDLQVSIRARNKTSNQVLISVKP